MSRVQCVYCGRHPLTWGVLGGATMCANERTCREHKNRTLGPVILRTTKAAVAGEAAQALKGKGSRSGGR